MHRISRVSAPFMWIYRFVCTLASIPKIVGESFQSETKCLLQQICLSREKFVTRCGTLVGARRGPGRRAGRRAARCPRKKWSDFSAIAAGRRLRRRRSRARRAIREKVIELNRTGGHRAGGATPHQRRRETNLARAKTPCRKQGLCRYTRAALCAALPAAVPLPVHPLDDPVDAARGSIGCIGCVGCIGPRIGFSGPRIGCIGWDCMHPICPGPLKSIDQKKKIKIAGKSPRTAGRSAAAPQRSSCSPCSSCSSCSPCSSCSSCSPCSS